MVVNDLPNPINPAVFIRGNASRRGKTVPRQFLAALAGPDRKPFQHGSGRIELAQAIVRPENPLTARVMVNRIWLHHFGAPLVGTPSDFGLRSDPPTHPELLDWLAATFVQNGWSIKSMHRLIMLSKSYQQQSELRAEGVQRDPQNVLLWRFNRRRLDFEGLRDALLAVSGRLDPGMGGRPVPLEKEPSADRRTVYGFIDRENLDGVFRTFDFASPDASSPRRHVTTVPQQALYLMNNPFVIAQAKHLSGRLARETADPEARLRRLYRLVLGREPRPHELALGLAFCGRPAAARTAVLSGPWLYGVGAYDGQAQRVSRFDPLPHWSGAAWQLGPKVPDPTGDYLTLSDSGGHVGRDQDHAAIRRWVAPRDAVVTIEATLGHFVDQGDGVRGRIISSRTGLLGSWVAKNAKVPTRVERVEVKQGETIDFVADCRETHDHDGFQWSPAIKIAGMRGMEWNARSEFHGPDPPPLAPWEEYAQVLLLTNEFAFVD
jgi:hypothetical protein